MGYQAWVRIEICFKLCQIQFLQNLFHKFQVKVEGTEHWCSIYGTNLSCYKMSHFFNVVLSFVITSKSWEADHTLGVSWYSEKTTIADFCCKKWVAV